MSFKSLIPPPPSEKERLKELGEISEQRKKYRPNKEKDEALDRVTVLFAELLGIPETEIKKVVDSIGNTISDHKNYFNIDRPSQLADKYGVEFDHDYHKLPSSHTKSYPSGHACQAHFLYLVYSGILPSKTEELKSISEEVAKARIDRGVHFPSDCRAGVLLAEELYKVKVNPKPKQKVASIVQELSTIYDEEIVKLSNASLVNMYKKITDSPTGAESFGAMAGISSAELGRRSLTGSKTKITIGGHSPVIIFHTDPLRGSGHHSQGKALAKALKDSGRSVEIVNIDRKYGRNVNKLNNTYKQVLDGTMSKTRYAINHHIPFYSNLDWIKFRKDIAGKQVVNMHAGLDVYMQHHVNKPMFTIHTDQSPFRTPGLKVQSNMPSQHLASESAAKVLLKENPNLRGRIHKVDALPITPTAPSIKDRVSWLKNRGKFNVVASGGGLGLGVDRQVQAILQSKNLPKGTVIHAVGAKSVMKNSGFYNPEQVSNLKKLTSEAAKKGVKVKVYEFAPLNYMMNKSDFNILRPGGTSITEARAAGVPFRVFNEAPITRTSISGRNTKALVDMYSSDILLKKTKPLDFNKALSKEQKQLFKSKMPASDGGASQMAKVINKRRTITYPKNIATIRRLSNKGIAGIAIATAAASLYKSGILKR